MKHKRCLHWVGISLTLEISFLLLYNVKRTHSNSSYDYFTTCLKEIPLYQILTDSSNYFIHQNFVVEDIDYVSLSHSLGLEIDALYINFIAT